MNKNRTVIISLFTLLLALFGVTVNGEQDDLTIESQFITYKQEAKHTMFEGDVAVKRGEIEIFADLVEHHWESDDGEYIVAKGSPVRFTHTVHDKDKEIRGSSSELIYRFEAQEVWLNENVKIEDNRTTLRTSQAVYNIQSAELRTISKPPESEGGERQKATISINEGE